MASDFRKNEEEETMKMTVKSITRAAMIAAIEAALSASEELVEAPAAIRAP